MTFSIRDLNLECSAIDAGDTTVAFVTPQGYVDWLLHFPDEKGKRIEQIDKETHTGNVRGLKFNLHMPHLCDQMSDVRVELARDAKSVTAFGLAYSKDNRLRSDSLATLAVNDTTGRYEWHLETRLACVCDQPVELPCVEFNNVLPGDVGGRFLWARRKRFDRTLILDRDGTIHEFPHQHTMHYSLHIDPLRGAAGGWAGFFGESLNPVVSVEASSGTPCWAICDAYFDLHCLSRTEQPLCPGDTWSWKYRIHWLDERQSAPLQSEARRVHVSDEQRRKWSGARLELGLNTFEHPVALDHPEEASAFLPAPPERVWEPSGGPDGKGCVVIRSPHAGETAWTVHGNTQIPPSTRLRISGLMKMEGAGCLFLRYHPHVFEWRPQAHIDWLPVVQSVPVTDTGGKWTPFSTPDFIRTADQRDTEIRFELVLDGPGQGALGAVTIEMLTEK